MKDTVIHLAADIAAEKFEHGGNRFNAAGFSNALCKITGVGAPLDGRIVRAILCGQSGIEKLSGGSHYRISWK